MLSSKQSHRVLQTIKTSRVLNKAWQQIGQYSKEIAFPAKVTVLECRARPLLLLHVVSEFCSSIAVLQVECLVLQCHFQHFPVPTLETSSYRILE